MLHTLKAALDRRGVTSMLSPAVPGGAVSLLPGLAGEQLWLQLRGWHHPTHEGPLNGEAHVICVMGRYRVLMREYDLGTYNDVEHLADLLAFPQEQSGSQAS